MGGTVLHKGVGVCVYVCVQNTSKDKHQDVNRCSQAEEQSVNLKIFLPIVII